MAFSKKLMSLLLLGVGVLADNSTTADSNATQAAQVVAGTTQAPCVENNATNVTCPPVVNNVQAVVTTAAATQAASNSNTTVTTTTTTTPTTTNAPSNATTTTSAADPQIDVDFCAPVNGTQAALDAAATALNSMTAAEKRALAQTIVTKVSSSVTLPADTVVATTAQVKAACSASRRRSLSERRLSTVSKVIQINVQVSNMPAASVTAFKTAYQADSTLLAFSSSDLTTALTAAGVDASAVTVTGAATFGTMTITPGTTTAGSTDTSSASGMMNAFNSFILMVAVAVMQKC